MLSKNNFIIYISLIFLIILSIISMSLGSVDISIYDILLGINEDKIDNVILYEIRLPRILLAISVGGSLSISGVILQSLFKNDLVEPYTLGISSASALAVAISIVSGLYNIFGNYILLFSSFIAAISFTMFILYMSVKDGVLKVKDLLLKGIVLSFFNSSLIMLIFAVTSARNLQEIIFWTMGSLSGANWALVLISMTVGLIGLIISYFFCFDLNALYLGDDQAKYIGIEVYKTKIIMIILTSILTSVSVAVSGVIGFVGLLIPHFIRFNFSKDHRFLLLLSFIFGANFLLISDMLARYLIAPLELPIGVIAGIFGSIIFLYYVKNVNN